MSESYWDAWDSTPPRQPSRITCRFALAAVVALIACARPAGDAVAQVVPPPVVRTVGFSGNPIVGPTGGQPGDILLLDASQAKAKSYAWECIPPALDGQGKPLVTIVPMGERAIVSSRPGSRTVILACVDEAGKVSLYQWPITIGQPNPTPPEPKPDDPPKPELTGIAKLSFDEAKKVNRQADCRKLASAQGGIASAIRAGGLKDPADILTAWRDANRAAVDRTYWASWGAAMAKEWERLHSTGEAKTADDFAKVLDEVKRGLEAAGG